MRSTREKRRNGNGRLPKPVQRVRDLLAYAQDLERERIRAERAASQIAHAWVNRAHYDGQLETAEFIPVMIPPPPVPLSEGDPTLR